MTLQVSLRERWSLSDDPKPEYIEIIGFSMRRMRFANKLLTVDF